eukprot:s5101_g4.t1
MTLTIKLDGNWSGFQLANNTKRLPSKKKQSEDLALESSRRRSPPEARRTLPPARLSFDSWASTRSGCGGRVANATESSASVPSPAARLHGTLFARLSASAFRVPPDGGTDAVPPALSRAKVMLEVLTGHPLLPPPAACLGAALSRPHHARKR